MRLGGIPAYPVLGLLDVVVAEVFVVNDILSLLAYAFLPWVW